MNNTLNEAFKKYQNKNNDESFENKIIKTLTYIYEDTSFLNDSKLNKLDNLVKDYEQTGNLDNLLSAYKIVIDLIVAKYQNKFIRQEEVEKYEEIFYDGLSIEYLNKYWDKALFKINAKANFKEDKSLFNPYTSYLQAMNINDIKALSDEELINFYQNIIDEYHLQLTDENLRRKIINIIRGKKCKN